MNRASAQVAPLAGSPAHGQRRIALVESAHAAAADGDERAQHAMRLLDTMLWVLKGTTRDTWATSLPDDADIVVIFRGEEAARAATWKSRGKFIVEIATEGDDAGAADNVLLYPFPAKRVLELLERFSAQLQARELGSTPSEVQVQPRAASKADRWALPEAIRTVRAVRNDNLWLVARDGMETVLWLRGDGSSYFTTEPLAQALRSDPLMTARLELRDGYPPPKARVAERSGLELFWFTGFHAGEALAPWLDSRQKYRVTAWPDFGVIRPEPAVLRAVAFLATEAHDSATLAKRARIPAGLAHRILNALSLCEVLAAGAAGTPADRGVGIHEPRGGFGGFLRRLRSHLGLGASA